MMEEVQWREVRWVGGEENPDPQHAATTQQKQRRKRSSPEIPARVRAQETRIEQKNTDRAWHRSWQNTAGLEQEEQVGEEGTCGPLTLRLTVCAQRGRKRCKRPFLGRRNHTHTHTRAQTHTRPDKRCTRSHANDRARAVRSCEETAARSSIGEAAAI